MSIRRTSCAKLSALGLLGALGLGLAFGSAVSAASAQELSQEAPTSSTELAPSAELSQVDGKSVQAIIPEDDLNPPAPPDRTLRSWRQALAYVRSRSTSLKSAEANVKRASAQSRLALSSMLIHITATGSINHHLLYGTGTRFTANGIETNVQIPNPATPINGNLIFRQPLLNAQGFYDIETARIGQEMAEHQRADSERLILGGVAESIIGVVTAEQLARTTRISRASARRTLELTRARFRMGSASGVDVLRAEQEVAAAESQVVRSDETLRSSRESLGTALGYSEAWGVSTEINLDSVAADARAVCKKVDDVQQRSDVKAAQKQLIIAERNVTSKNLQWVPQIDLASDVTYTNAPFTVNGRPVQWTVGAIITMPIYDGGRKFAERDMATADADNARENITQLKRTANLQVTQANRGVQVASQELALAQSRRDTAQKGAELARTAFINGTGSSFDMIDTERRAREAEIDLAIKEFEVGRAQILSYLAQANCEI